MRRTRQYFSSLTQDFPSAIVVSLVALPLCLGIALGSQAPLFSGLIAGIVGGIVVGFLSGSSLSVSGPAAGLTTIVAAAITTLPSYESFLVAVVIAGCFQMVLGLLKAGVIGDYVPGTVIKGMLAAIGLILVLKQFPHLIGYDKNYEGDEAFLQPDQQNTFSQISQAFRSISPLAVLIGVLSLLLQFVWENWKALQQSKWRMIPAPLLVVLIGVSFNEGFKSMGSTFAIDPEHLIVIPIANTPAEFLSFFKTPDWTMLFNQQVWVVALTISLVASLETLLSIEAVDELDALKRVTPTNRELQAQGVGNVLSGLMGGLPITSVIVRSSANVNAGAKTKFSTILHGIILLLCVVGIPHWLNLIPKSALAAILIYTGFKLAKPSLFKKIYSKGWDQFIPFVITIVSILVTDLLTGVIIGIVSGLFFILRSNFHSAVFTIHDQNNYLFRLRKDVSFLNKPILKKRLETVPAEAYVLIDTSRADFIDKDVIEVLEDFMLHAHLKNIRVELKQNMLTNQGFTLPLTTLPASGYGVYIPSSGTPS